MRARAGRPKPAAIAVPMTMALSAPGPSIARARQAARAMAVFRTRPKATRRPRSGSVARIRGSAWAKSGNSAAPARGTVRLSSRGGGAQGGGPGRRERGGEGGGGGQEAAGVPLGGTRPPPETLAPAAGQDLPVEEEGRPRHGRGLHAAHVAQQEGEGDAPDVDQ